MIEDWLYLACACFNRRIFTMTHKTVKYSSWLTIVKKLQVKRSHILWLDEFVGNSIKFLVLTYNTLLEVTKLPWSTRVRNHVHIRMILSFLSLRFNNFINEADKPRAWLIYCTDSLTTSLPHIILWHYIIITYMLF